MSSPRRFPPPSSIEEHHNACFIVKDATGQALGHFYFEDEPGRRDVLTQRPHRVRNTGITRSRLTGEPRR